MFRQPVNYGGVGGSNSGGSSVIFSATTSADPFSGNAWSGSSYNYSGASSGGGIDYTGISIGGSPYIVGSSSGGGFNFSGGSSGGGASGSWGGAVDLNQLASGVSSSSWAFAKGAVGGFLSSLGSGIKNAAIGIGNALLEIPRVSIDIQMMEIETIGLMLGGPPLNYQPMSMSAAFSQSMTNDGYGYLATAGTMALTGTVNTFTFGGLSTAMGAADYVQTGDPAARQGAAGVQLFGALGLKSMEVSGALTPINLDTVFSKPTTVASPIVPFGNPLASTVIDVGAQPQPVIFQQTVGSGAQSFAGLNLQVAPTATTSGSVFYGTTTGQLIAAPPGYQAVTAQNGKGLVLLPEGQPLGNNSNIIRYGEPNAQNPGGYFRYYNSQGQPLNPRASAHSGRFRQSGAM